MSPHFPVTWSTETQSFRHSVGPNVFQNLNSSDVGSVKPCIYQIWHIYHPWKGLRPYPLRQQFKVSVLSPWIQVCPNMIKKSFWFLDNIRFPIAGTELWSSSKFHPPKSYQGPLPVLPLTSEGLMALRLEQSTAPDTTLSHIFLIVFHVFISILIIHEGRDHVLCSMLHLVGLSWL